MSLQISKHVGGSLGVLACGAATATAAGTGDATAVTGASINRSTYGMPESALIALGYRTSLTAAKTLSLAVEVQYSADGSSWDTAVALLASTVVKTGAATNFNGEYVIELSLLSQKQYFRINFTPDLSHSSTDTVDIACVAILGNGWKASLLPANDVEQS